MALYMLFSTYGPVLDVVALKTMKMRGQAHIVYRDTQTSTQAMRALNGFTFLGRQIVRVFPVPQYTPFQLGAWSLTLFSPRPSHTPRASRMSFQG